MRKFFCLLSVTLVFAGLAFAHETTIVPSDTTKDYRSGLSLAHKF